MKCYKAEPESDLKFSFPDGVNYEELDKQGEKLPVGMKLVDLVIERDKDVLLVEIKDPSNTRTLCKERKKYFKRLSNDSILTKDLTPKARDSYTFLHLMKRDTKPLIYVVLIGLDAYDPTKQKALLTTFKDRLLARIRCETDTPWELPYIADCIVVSVEIWNKTFPDWPVTRLSQSG